MMMMAAGRSVFLRAPLLLLCLYLPRRIHSFSVLQYGAKAAPTNPAASGTSCTTTTRPSTAVAVPPPESPHRVITNLFLTTTRSFATSLATTACIMSLVAAPLPAVADSGGASAAANAKLTTGGASTLQSGRTISITRGVNLDGSDFHNQNLKGVAFQQSIVRDADFRNSNLVGASFFDATVDGSDFENADMTLANVEMAQFNRANLKNAVLHEMYVSGATLFTGVKSIENTDWSETYLRADQQKYLCEHPTAKGTNPTTGVDTRESLLCRP